MDDERKKEITMDYRREMNKIPLPFSYCKKDISTLLYSHSINEIESCVKNLSSFGISKSLYKDIFVKKFLNKNVGVLTTVLNINGIFIFGNNEIFNNIANTHYQFVEQDQSFIIVRDNVVINHLVSENGEYVWLREKVKHTMFCNEFDFISNDQKKKIIESIKSMAVLNTLCENKNAVTLT